LVGTNIHSSLFASSISDIEQSLKNQVISVDVKHSFIRQINKLDGCSPKFRGKARSLPWSGALARWPAALLANIRLGQKGLPGAYDVAYLPATLVTKSLRR
jgi:hypothetical protein